MPYKETRAIIKKPKHCAKHSRAKITCLLAAYVVFAALRSESQAQLTEVHMGVAFTNARVAPLWIADKEGFSKKTALTSGSSIFPVELKGHRRYREGLQTIIAEVGKEVPKAAGLKFEEIANPAIVQKLDKSGFIDGLYK